MNLVSRFGGRMVMVAVALAVADGSGTAWGQDRAKTPVKATENLSNAEAETVALAFVRENHPELAALLAQLKAMKPEEYQRAIRELAQVARSLAVTRESNPKRYETALGVWKARSRVNLLAARLAGASAPGPELEGQLRQAVEALVDAEVRQQRLETETAEERLRRARVALERMESRHDAAVEARFQSLLKKSRRPLKTARTVEPAKPNVNAEPGVGKPKRETQP